MPILNIDFYYYDALKDLDLIKKKSSQVVVDDKQALNTCIKENALKQIITAITYLINNKDLPEPLKYYEEDFIGSDKFLQEYANTYFDDLPYIEFEY